MEYWVIAEGVLGPLMENEPDAEVHVTLVILTIVSMPLNFCYGTCHFVPGTVTGKLRFVSFMNAKYVPEPHESRVDYGFLVGHLDSPEQQQQHHGGTTRSTSASALTAPPLPPLFFTDF